jgi:hypothetical protein
VLLKRIYAIFFLLIFSFQMAGFYVFFKVRQNQIRKEIKRALKKTVPRDELVIITVSPENTHELRWEKSHEFELKGRMYDVLLTEYKADGSIAYHCIDDKQETVLFAQLDEHVKRTMDSESGKKGNGYEFFKQIFLLSESNFFNNTTTTTSIRNSRQFYTSYHSPILDLSSPPPEHSDI